MRQRIVHGGDQTGASTCAATGREPASGMKSGRSSSVVAARLVCFMAACRNTSNMTRAGGHPGARYCSQMVR